MTIAEMQDRFMVLRDLYKAPYYEPNERDSFINSAISAFVTGSIPSELTERKKKENQKLWDQISTLIRVSKETSFTTAGVSDNIPMAKCSFTKPTDFWFFYGAICIISGEATPTSMLTFNELTNINQDSFSQPSDSNVGMIAMEDKMYLICDTVPDSFYLYYIKKPAVVNFQTSTHCDLPLSTHDKICHMAVQLSCGGSALFDLYKIEENEVNKR